MICATKWSNEGSSAASASDKSGAFLKGAQLKPHKVEYWLNPKIEDAEAFREEVGVVCDIYRDADVLHATGVHVVSCDEKTGIQALSRAAPTKPMRPGIAERPEHEYIRHGTLCLMANFEVATGRVIAPSIGSTRDEADFRDHIEKMIDTDPAGEWVFIVDQLNTHMSESLVLLVAERCGLNEPLGIKGKSGVLQSMRSRQEFLSTKTHRIRFVYTPKHCSWLNQVECWFSVLAKRLLRRGNFTSLEHLRTRILAFIEHFNLVLAKPYRWTHTGRPLQG